MNQDDAEREVFARVRSACARSSPERIAQERAALPATTRPVQAGATLLETLIINLERNGASVACVSNRGAAVAAISAFIATRHQQRRVVTGHDPRLAALPWRDGGLLPRFGRAQAGERVAVSYANAGIAETGSLALWINRDNPALNNLLAEDHVVLLDHADLYPALEDLWQPEEALHVGNALENHAPAEPVIKSRTDDGTREADAGAPKAPRPTHAKGRGLMLISGPSSTADIGMQLVMGAHGPRALHVIIVGDESPKPQ